MSENTELMANPITSGEADAPQGMGMASDDNAPLRPTGSHGGGMGSGSGLDTDDLQDGTDGKPVMTDTKSADGAGTGNYASDPGTGETDSEMTGMVGEVSGDDKAAGGI